MVLGLCACETQPIQKKYYFFDTFVDITLYEKGNQKGDPHMPVYLSLSTTLSLYDQYSNNYSTDNDLYKINQAPGEYVIEEGLYVLLNKSLELKEITNGYFNPLVGSLSKKWKESLSKNEILSQVIINEELEKINNSSFTLKKEDNTCKIIKYGTAEIDFGAMVKGLALDASKGYLNSININKYIINAGNSSILLGEKNTKDGYFNVGLKDVKNAYLSLKNCFIGVSGVSEQGKKIDNQYYSHIVNPFTGSVINKYDMAFVKGDNGALCDALSTAFMLMDVEEVKTFESKYNVQALLYKDDEFVYKNNNLEVKYH